MNAIKTTQQKYVIKVISQNRRLNYFSALSQTRMLAHFIKDIFYDIKP